MVLKFSCSESRLLTMGIQVLKKLVLQAKSSKDVITLEATVVTGFEVQAVDECKEKCKPIDIFRAKGRIFFNIKKDSYPNVLRMRSIDNVFLVGDCFEELKLKGAKDEDLTTIRELVDGVEWSKSVPEWAAIMDFKGVQFPKCAKRDPDQPLDETEPICQNCKNPKKDGGESDLVVSEAGEAEANNGVGEVGSGDVHDVGVCSPKDLIPDEGTFQTPPDKITACSISDEGTFQTPPDNLTAFAPKVLISDEGTFQTPPDNCAALTSETCCQDQGCLKNSDSAVELNTSPEGLLSAKSNEETDDEAFHSAEEDLIANEMIVSETGDVKLCTELSKDKSIHPTSTSIDPEEINSADGAWRVLEVDSNKPNENQKTKKKSKWEKKKEAKANKAQYDAAKKETRGDPANHGSETADVSSEPKQPGEKKMSYWQRRREAKKAHDAMKNAAKPPRKAYIDDGIMKFRVTCHRNGRHSFSSNEAAGNFGGVINDKFHWTVDLTKYDINVVLVVEDDSAYISYGLTRSSFHRRNIKNFGPTTMRATMCYGLMRFAEPKPGEIILDPMCGGGSISIEGALAFPKTYHICGDVNEKCIERVAENIAFNSQEKPLMMDGLRWSVRRLPLRDQCIDVVVTDLPFGLRVGKQKDNTGLYTAALVELARVVRCGRGRASLITYDRTAMIRALRKTSDLWREIHVNAINQGGLRCFAYLLLRRAAADPVPPKHLDAPTEACAVSAPQEDCADPAQMTESIQDGGDSADRVPEPDCPSEQTDDLAIATSHISLDQNMDEMPSHIPREASPNNPDNA